MRAAVLIVSCGLGVLALACGGSAPLVETPLVPASGAAGTGAAGTSSAAGTAPTGNDAAAGTSAPVDAAPGFDAVPGFDAAPSFDAGPAVDAGAIDVRADVGPCVGDACRRIVKVVVGGGTAWQACALYADGTVSCWVNGMAQNAPAGAVYPVPGLDDATTIWVVGSIGCARRASGGIACWKNAAGQYQADTGPTALMAAASFANAIDIAPGYLHSCALFPGDRVLCWGYNELGALGDGTRISSEDPVLAGISGATSISIGEYHSCALLADRTVACWGDNSRMQLGRPTLDDSAEPAVVPGLSDVMAVSSSGYGSCALRGDGHVLCWGMGGGTTPTVAVAIDGLTDAVALTGGNYGACARTKGGRLACWGSNNYGAFGDGTRADSASARVVPGLDGVVDASTTGARACALLSAGSVWCWGVRALYSTGFTTSDLSPVKVEGL